ncbi:swi5-like zinc finger protein [Geranomyces variabilis]|uniref:Swi5-like zinc finger protein n=1 Tax=Geranomyces variabilis TaxID=109894 RepID=A0AAD5TBC7_9FUNG|nr:swi5-like zinc finger protein [Geranomyces variabilis]
MLASMQDHLTARLLSILQEARRPLASTEFLAQFQAGDARTQANACLETMLAAGQIAQPYCRVKLTAGAMQDALERNIAGLRAKVAELENEKQALEAELKPGTDVDAENAAHIKRLHDYNEVKDTGQMLLGKLAEFEGTTTRAMYERFDLGLED